jgi:hypothetical protein
MSGPEAVLTFNGVNGGTGRYDVEPLSAEAFSQIVIETVPLKPGDKAHLEELERRRLRDTEAHYAPKEGIDPKKLEEAGWGVIFAFGASPAVYEALSPLLKLRKQQAGDRYREYLGPDAYRPAESKQDFLKRHGAGPGPVDPLVVPYYLLIVGDPDSISFRFQYQLDVQYAVGRIHFESIADYAVYAESVVAAETGTLALPRRAAIFGVANNGDGATRLSHDELAGPLAEWAITQNGWTVDKYLNGDATKARLGSLLGGEAPAFLFTASHGMCYDNGDERQVALQGALLCQDWPGPTFQGAIPNDFFFASEDVASDARVFGMIAMHFACFGAGTPRLSDFSPSGPPHEIAPRSFLGRLPQRLIAHPRGGALAVIGHVERAWGCSFHWDRAGSQTEVFKSTIKRLMEGHPVGSALEYFNGRYAELSSDLSTALADIKYGATVDPYLLSGLWTANNDARSYSVIGDPAVRLMLVHDSLSVNRPILEVNSVPIAPDSPQQPASQPPIPPPANAALVDYGVIDSVRGAAASLQEAAQKIGAWLADSFQTVTSVHVSTYVSESIKDVKYVDGVFSGAELRAVTIANLDGNTVVCVPEQDGKVDDALWKIHSDTFDKALANRVELLKTAAAAIASLVPGVKSL